jgi:4-hydroxybenzoate polyprenyltransferase
MGLGAALGLVIGQYDLIKKRDKAMCFTAFLFNNWIGLVIFLGIAVEYYTHHLSPLNQ